jgi:hypothetical protein
VGWRADVYSVFLVCAALPAHFLQEYLRQRPLNPEDARLLRDLLNERDVVSHALKAAQTHVDNAVAWLYNSPNSRNAPVSEAEQLDELNKLRRNLVELRSQQLEKIRLLKMRRVAALSRGPANGLAASISLHHLRSTHDRTMNAPPSVIYSSLRSRLETSFSKDRSADTTQIVNQSRGRVDQSTGRTPRSGRSDEPNNYKDKYAPVHADRSASTPKHRALRVKKAPEYVVSITYPRAKKALIGTEMAAGAAATTGPQPRVPLLAVSKGDKVIVTAKANTGWWEAQRGQDTGLVRSTYLRPLYVIHHPPRMTMQSLAYGVFLSRTILGSHFGHFLQKARDNLSRRRFVYPIGLFSER